MREGQTHQILSLILILLLQVFINETFVNSITSSRCLKMSSEINESSSDELIDIGKILSEQMPIHLVSLSQNLTASQLPPSTALIITCAARGCCIGRSLCVGRQGSVAFCRLLWVVLLWVGCCICCGSVALCRLLWFCRCRRSTTYRSSASLERCRSVIVG